MAAPTPDDWTLLNAAAREPDALARLFQRHKDRVFRVAWTLVGDYGGADDVTQDVFLRIARTRKRYRAQAKFTTWLHTVTLNTARDWLRRQSRHPQAVDDQALERLTADTDLDPLLRDLVTAMRDLSDRQREIVVLRILEGYSTKETAKIAGVSVGTVKTHLHRALGQIRPHLC